MEYRLSLCLDENTKIDSYTEVFGKVGLVQIDDVTLDITTNPKVIQPDQEGILNITFHDKQNNIIQDSKVSLQFIGVTKKAQFLILSF